jgi:hypothetical protein
MINLDNFAFLLLDGLRVQWISYRRHSYRGANRVEHHRVYSVGAVHTHWEAQRVMKLELAELLKHCLRLSWSHSMRGEFMRRAKSFGRGDVR